MPKQKSIHLRSIRLFNNAGIEFPVCCIPKSGPLDVDKSRLDSTGNMSEVTCKKCIKKIEKLKHQF